jgi:alpha-galactosidase
VGAWRLRVEASDSRLKVRIASSRAADGLTTVRFRFTAAAPITPAPITVTWHHPLLGAHFAWRPGGHTDRALRPDWHPSRVTSQAASHAPVLALFGSGDRNALTFALSDALNTAELSAGVVEETAEAVCRVKLFAAPMPPIDCYEVTLRLDARPLPVWRVLDDVAVWWESLPGLAPGPVPEHARLPVYSTWYAFHQRLDPAAIERQCRLAKELGMETVILDDGWQTGDNRRGYAFCGDWEPFPEKFPDFAGHVRRVHDLGMRYMVWIGLPFVGRHSRAFRRLRGRFLDPDNPQGWHTLDPRFPDVREHLIALCEGMVRRYGVDGLKLDFIDAFQPDSVAAAATGGGRDLRSVPEAAARLMTDLLARLRRIAPEVLIEFRQSYVGPLMRACGNLFRAGDVPADFLGNRLRTLDVRLLSRSTPAHSDMLMWHPGDAVERAALQLAHTLFAVPQISVLIDRLPPAHRAMLRFYLRLWRAHRDVLLDGSLMPQGLDMLYPVVVARTPAKLAAAVYAPSAVARIAGALPPTALVVNGTLESRVIVDLARASGLRRATAYTCTGVASRARAVRLRAGVQALAIPPSGVLVLEE